MILTPTWLFSFLVTSVRISSGVGVLQEPVLRFRYDFVRSQGLPGSHEPRARNLEKWWGQEVVNDLDER